MVVRVQQGLTARRGGVIQEMRATPSWAVPSLMGCHPTGSEHSGRARCQQGPWAAPETAEQWIRFRVWLGVQSGANRKGIRGRAEDKTITWVQSLSRTQDQTLYWRKLQHSYEGYLQEAGLEMGTCDTAQAKARCLGLSWNGAGGHLGRGGMNLQVRLVRATEA